MIISDYEKENMSDILLGKGDWFGAKLLRLIAVADKENRYFLELGFPDYVEAYEKFTMGVKFDEN